MVRMSNENKKCDELLLEVTQILKVYIQNDTKSLDFIEDSRRQLIL